MTPIIILSLAVANAEPTYIIRGATVYDGTGKPGAVGDVAITGSRITAVGNVEALPGATIIEGKGLVVAPGFIDLHTHCDGNILREGHRPNTCYITQGVTTIVTGNCGSGPVDAASFFKSVEDGGVGTNVIHQVPHNSVREAVMGNANRIPTADEVQKMCNLVEKAMKDGAWNLSTGLIYNPGTYSKTEELITLAKVSAKYGGHYASHIRSESAHHLDAVAEAIRIGREANCPVHISHIKCSGKAYHGNSVRAVALIEKARVEGQAVTADQYPYIASSTSLRAQIIPSQFREGTSKEYLARLDDPATREKIERAVTASLKDGSHIQVARYSPKPAWNGKRISEISRLEVRSPLEIVMEIERHGSAQIVNFGMSEEDVRVYMKQPWVATASDGSTQVKGNTVPHPRSYGTFSRKIGKYSIEDNVIPLAQAIYSSSGLPADILKLKDRGYVKTDCFADVVVFDPKTFRDVATYDNPHQLSTGIMWMFVNGKLVIENGKHKPDVLAGVVLRRNNRIH